MGATAAPPEAVAQDWAAKWGSDPRVRSLAATAPQAPSGSTLGGATAPTVGSTSAPAYGPASTQRVGPVPVAPSSAPSALHIPSVEDVFGPSVPRRVQPAPAMLPPDERHQQDRATADAPTTRGIKDWKPSSDSGDLGPSQFGPEAQATGVAASICGPIAAVQFAAAYGRAPSVAEAVALAKQNGNWDAGTGMHGPDSEASLLDSMGVPNRIDHAPSKDAVIRDVTTGNPVILSSPNHYHYFVASGYDPSTGLFDTGNTGEALKGGSRWRSWDDIAPQAALFVDEPSTPVHSQAVDPTTMGGVRREQQAQAANTGSPAAAMRSADQAAYDAYDTPEAREAFVRDRSARYGIDPNVAVAVVNSEGGFDSWNRQSDYVHNGVREPSFGPMQLYMNGGLGNAFMSETGLDPRDPANGPAATDWALRYAAQHGWGDWHGAQRIGLDNYAGINGNPANLPPADVPGGASGGRGPGMAAPLPRDNPAGPYTDPGANPDTESAAVQPAWTDPTGGYLGGMDDVARGVLAARGPRRSDAVRSVLGTTLGAAGRGIGAASDAASGLLHGAVTSTAGTPGVQPGGSYGPYVDESTSGLERSTTGADYVANRVEDNAARAAREALYAGPEPSPAHPALAVQDALHYILTGEAAPVGGRFDPNPVAALMAGMNVPYAAGEPIAQTAGGGLINALEGHANGGAEAAIARAEALGPLGQAAIMAMNPTNLVPMGALERSAAMGEKALLPAERLAAETAARTVRMPVVADEATGAVRLATADDRWLNTPGLKEMDLTPIQHERLKLQQARALADPSLAGRGLGPQDMADIPQTQALLEATLPRPTTRAVMAQGNLEQRAARLLAPSRGPAAQLLGNAAGVAQDRLGAAYDQAQHAYRDARDYAPTESRYAAPAPLSPTEGTTEVAPFANPMGGRTPDPLGTFNRLRVRAEEAFARAPQDAPRDAYGFPTIGGGSGGGVGRGGTAPVPQAVSELDAVAAIGARPAGAPPVEPAEMARRRGVLDEINARKATKGTLLDFVRNVTDKDLLVGTPAARKLLLSASDNRSLPEYLEPVLAFTRRQRAKMLAGQMTERDVAKAYYMTVASQGSKEQAVTTIQRRLKLLDVPLDLSAPENAMFLDRAPKTGVLTIRPEEAAAAWLFTPNGKRALDLLEHEGVYDEALWREGANVRVAFGDDRLGQTGALSARGDTFPIHWVENSDPRAEGAKVNIPYRPGISRNNPKTGIPSTTHLYDREGNVVGEATPTATSTIGPKQYTLRPTELREATAAINAAAGNSAAMGKAIGRFRGIAKAKTPFVKQLLGLGDMPTLDALELNYWLSGQASPRGPLSTVAKEVARGLKGDVADEMQRYVMGVMEELRHPWVDEQGITHPALAEGVENEDAFALIHHWLWDALKSEQSGGPVRTTHMGLHAAQERAGVTSFHDIPLDPEAIARRQFGYEAGTPQPPSYLSLADHPLIIEPRDLTAVQETAARPAGVAAGTGPDARTQATAKRIVKGSATPDLGTAAGVRGRKAGADTPTGLDLALTRAQALDRPNAERLLASVADQYERLSPARAEAATAAVKAAWTRLHGAENAGLFDAFLPYADAMNARNRVTMTFVGPKALLALADRGIFTNLASVAKDYPALADMHAGSVGAERYVKAIEKLRKNLTPEQVKARGFDLTDAEIERLGGRDFVRRLQAADTAAFGATNVPTDEAYAMDPLGTQRLYAYQTLGQPEIGDYHGALGDPKGLNVGLAWRDRARGEEGPFYVSSLLHHFAKTSPQYPIHGSMGKLFQDVLWAPGALEGERGATLFGPLVTPTREAGIDVGQGRFMGKTNLLVGPNAADRAQSLNLLLGMSKDTPASIALREGRITTPEDLYAALSAGGTGQNNPLYRRYNMALGLKENAAVPEAAKANLGLSYTPNRTRQEALILDPHPEGIKYFYARGTHDELMNTVIPGAGESGRDGRTTFEVLRDAQRRAGGPERAPIVLYDQTVPLDAAGQPSFPEARDIPSHARVVNPDGTLGPTVGEAMPDVAPDRPNLRRSYTGLGLVSIDADGNRVPVRNMGQVDVNAALMALGVHGAGGGVAGLYGAATAPEGSTPQERLDRAIQYAPYGVAGAFGAVALGGGAALAAKSLSRGGPHVATLGSNLVKAGDTLRSFYAANLMSNPASQFRNITSNILSMATQPIESELGAASFGLAKRLAGQPNAVRTRYGHQEVKAATIGTLRGAVDGFNTMMEILASGETAAPTAWGRALGGGGLNDLSSATNGGRTVVRDLPMGVSSSRGTLGNVASALATPITAPLNYGVLRPMTATDEFFKGIVYNQAVATEFYRMARAKGLKGAAADRFVTANYHVLRNPPVGMGDTGLAGETLAAVQRAGKYARYQTYQQEMDKIGTGLTILQKIPVFGSFLMPFTRTPYNILKYGLERSPAAALSIGLDWARGVYNPASDLAKAHPEKLRDVGDLADRLARFELGMGFFAASIGLYRAGILTGAAPTDKGEAAAWRLAGNKEFSIHIPGTDLFIPMLQIPSLGPTMAATVGVLDARAKQMQDAAKHPDEPPPSLLEQGARAFDGAVASMQQQGFAQAWQSLASLIDGFSGRQGAPSENLQSPLTRQLGSIATGLVPGSAAMRAVTSAPEPVTVAGHTVIPAPGDRYDRLTPGILDDPQAIIPPAAGALGIPNASQLRPQSVLGRPIPRQRRNVLDTLFNPLSVVGDRTDAVDRELSALGIQVPGVGSTVEGQKLTADQRNAYEDALARQARPMFSGVQEPGLDQLVADPDYRALPPDRRKRAVSGMIDDARTAARLQLLSSGAADLPTLRNEAAGEPVRYDSETLAPLAGLTDDLRERYAKNPDAFDAAIQLARAQVARWQQGGGQGEVPDSTTFALASLYKARTAEWQMWAIDQMQQGKADDAIIGALSPD